jgi:hypothetical protein
MSNLLKYTIEHYRKEGVSTETFEKFFKDVHLPTALQLMTKYGFVKYSVVGPSHEVKRVRGREFQADNRRV